MVAAAVLQALIQNLIELSKKETSLFGGLQKKAKKLRGSLHTVQEFLNGAEMLGIDNEAVSSWLKKVEDVAFDADNILDELNYYLSNKIKARKPTKQTKVLSRFSSFNHVVSPRKIAPRIKEINEILDSFNKEATELGLVRRVFDWPTFLDAAAYETDSFNVDPIFIGRDNLVLEIVEMLKTSTKSDERGISTLSIVGMGGSGKTTLTRKVVNHEKMKIQFGSIIWVHVSRSFDPIMIFKKILTILTSQTIDRAESRQVTLKKLAHDLKDKTYLLVLDDVWCQESRMWEDFMNLLMEVTSTKGNAIVVTTRNMLVASAADALHIHQLKGLSDEDCWSIIKEKTFGKDDVPLEFEFTGRKIARRCEGLPLAANLVGGVLMHDESEGKWALIEEKLFPLKDGNNIMKILRLSFDSLSPPSLKKCFAYCSVFPKGHKMKKQELIEHWMAEGCLYSGDGSDDMESLGDKFMNDLLHSSLLQVSSRDEYGNVEWCDMHDLAHDLSCSVSGYPCDGGFRSQVRYMTILEDKMRPMRKEEAKLVRTLFIKDAISSTKFSDFESLHDLTLDSDKVENLPVSIRKLIHLRNLNISYTRIEILPEWIGEFHHLQTLRADIFHMKKLPSKLKYLINLRHLYINNNVELPAEIGRLTCLQTLEHFAVGEERGHRIKELGSLNNLKGDLTIDNLEKVDGRKEAAKANISQKPNLIKLVLRWYRNREGSSTNDENVLEGLQPHPNLKKLQIWGFKGKRFPLWTMKMEGTVSDGPQASWVPLNKLIQLTLNECDECDEIPMLGYLPNLKSLVLQGLKKVRFINPVFDKLTQLHVLGLEGLECLPDRIFYYNQSLSDLKIEKCPKLRELPDGLHTLHSLEELCVLDCPNLKSIGNDNPISGGQSRSGILRKLLIERCGGLMELPCRMVELWGLSLQTLSLVEVSSLKNLPVLVDRLEKSARLTELRIVGSVPKFMATCGFGRGAFGSLRLLDIYVSEERSRESSVVIKETVESILQGCSCNSLTSLKLGGREDWESIPESILHLTALSSLKLENFGVEELPEWLGNLSSLKDMSLHSCSKLRRLPSTHALERLCKLEYLDIEGCPELRIVSEWFNIPHLHINVDGLRIQSCSHPTDALVKGPQPASSSSLAADEISKEGIPLPKMSSSSYSHEIVESGSHEIAVVTDVEIEEAVVSSTNAAERRIRHHMESSTETVYFKEEQIYSVVEENNHLKIKLDNQSISIGDVRSSSTVSPVNDMLNIVERDLPELSEKPNFPNSLILLLQRNKRLSLIHPSFFDTLLELQFLDISDTKIRILPSSLFKLSKLKVLLLRNCICLETLPPEIGRLIQLEVLDLSGTELYELPNEIGQLELVRSMQLSFYGPDDESEYEHLPSQLVSPTFLFKLKEIEALRIIVHPEDHRWTETVACIIQDMSKLEMLSSLQFYFPEVETFENFIRMSPSWKNQRLIKFDFTLGHNVKRIASQVPDKVESLFSQHERCLRYVDGDEASPLLKSVLARVSSLYLDHHTQVQSLSEFDISNFNELKFCVVRECPKIHTILDEKTARVALPRLEYLGIFFLWELKHIWKPPSHGGRLERPLENKNFEALRHLIIKTCPKLQFILWESMIPCLANLEELVVEDCERVEKIIKEENKKVKNENYFLSGLKELVLLYLPELITLGNGVHLSEEEIIVYGCPKFESQVSAV